MIETNRKIVSAVSTAMLFTAGVSACGPLDNPYRPFPEPDYSQYVARVQPIVARRCSALGCHGSYDRTLTLFALDMLRAEAIFSGEPLDETKLTDAELVANYDAMRIRLLDVKDADESSLLLKCLDPDKGGVEHSDVVVFESTNVPDYQTLRTWIETGL